MQGTGFNRRVKERRRRTLRQGRAYGANHAAMAGRSRGFTHEEREGSWSATVSDCVREGPDEAVEVVSAFRAGGKHTGLEGQRRVLCRAFVLHDVWLIGLLLRSRLLFLIWELRAAGLLDFPGSDATLRKVDAVKCQLP